MIKKIFKAFFGMGPSLVKETVVLSPIIYPKQLERISGQKGKHYKTILSYQVANFGRLTFIKTPMTQAAVSDLVVLLPKTPCREVIFVGAMGGLAKGLKIGDVFKTSQAKDVHSVKSLYEETTKRLISLRKKGVAGVDFESRAFFAAAKKGGLSATAYFVVTDLPLTRPFYSGTLVKEKKKIQDSIVEILRVFEP